MKESKPYRSIAIKVEHCHENTVTSLSAVNSGPSFCSTWFVFLPASFARRILTNEAVSLMTPHAVRLKQRCKIASANVLSAFVFLSTKSSDAGFPATRP